MKKDILDKVQLKNTKNLSENISRPGELTHLTTDLQKERINDDFSNLDQLIDEGEMTPLNNRPKFNT